MAVAIKKIIFDNLPSLLIYLMIFLFLASPMSDPDFGWHLRYGELLFNKREFLFNDAFSWTMKGFPWIDISWTYDLAIYFLYTRFGFTPLAVIEGLLFCAGFYLLTAPYKLTYIWKSVYSYFYVLFAMGVAGAGFRVQIFEVFNICIFNYLYYQINVNNKVKYSLFFPILLLFWVNIHGSFIVGFGLISIFLLSKIINLFLYKYKYKNKSQKFLSTLIYYSVSLVLSAIALILSPGGIKTVLQVISYIPQKRIEGISEWYPLNFFSDGWLIMFVWTIIVLILILKKRRSTVGLFQSFTVLIFAYLAYGSRRMVAPYFIMSTPIILMQLSLKPVKSYFINILIIIFITSTVISGFYKVVKNKFYNYSIHEYCEKGIRCSAGAAKFINSNKIPEPIFNSYNYGGFINWTNPQLKLFIDGRMDQWAGKNNYRVFLDSQIISSKGDMELFDKYKFKTVYIQKGIGLEEKMRNLVKDKIWKVGYEDNNAVIFIKNQ